MNYQRSKKAYLLEKVEGAAKQDKSSFNYNRMRVQKQTTHSSLLCLSLETKYIRKISKLRKSVRKLKVGLIPIFKKKDVETLT